jgi:hypothetical protein
VQILTSRESRSRSCSARSTEATTPDRGRFDPGGRLFVTDADLHRVLVFEPGAETALAGVGRLGLVPGLFSEPPRLRRRESRSSWPIARTTA